MNKYWIKNAKAVVTCDGADRVLRNCDIFVEDGKIKEIGPSLEAKTKDDYTIIKADDMFVYPGLINTHHHFFQTFARNLAAVDIPNISLSEWLSTVYDIFRNINTDVVFYASLAAMADLVKHGCTCAFDHQYCFTPYTGNTPIDVQMRAADMIGIRLHAGRGTNTLPKEKGSTMPIEMVETTDAYLKDCERVIKLYHDPASFSMHRIVMAPCQPINCYKETFVETVKMARENGVFMHTHLCEGETDAMLARWGKRSVAWCEDVGFIGPDVWYAHGNEIIPEEYPVLGKAGSGIAHCAAATTTCGATILDMIALAKAGVCVSLGCDGCASNDGSNLLDSIRIAYLMQAFHSKQRGGSLSPYEVFKLATVNGAKTLGRPELGSLEKGKAADLFMIDTGTLEMAGALHDPKNIIPKIGLEGPVALTMINGKIVFKDGVLTGVDERELARKGEEVCTSVLRSSHKAYSVM